MNAYEVILVGPDVIDRLKLKHYLLVHRVQSTLNVVTH